MDKEFIVPDLKFLQLVVLLPLYPCIITYGDAMKYNKVFEENRRKTFYC